MCHIAVTEIIEESVFPFLLTSACPSVQHLAIKHQHSLVVSVATSNVMPLAILCNWSGNAALIIGITTIATNTTHVETHYVSVCQIQYDVPAIN